MTKEELIYQILSSTDDFMTTKRLAHEIGFDDERKLRAQGKEVGVLERAKAYAYRVHRKLMVTNYKGVRLFDNPDDALAWAAKKKQRWVSEKRSINKEQIRAEHLRIEKTQISMAI